MKYIVKLVRLTLKIFGYDMIKSYRYDGGFDKVYHSIFSSRKNEVCILDIGAHRGESINRFNHIFDKPEIHAFEPVKENFDYLTSNFMSKRIKINNKAVGSKEGNLELNTFIKSDVGSFIDLKKDDPWIEIRSKQFGASKDDFNTGKVNVPVTTVDSYIEANNISKINLLKIDTQGFEDEVLIGCKNALSNGVIEYIELELIITGPYEKSLSFSDIESKLLPYGYKVYGINKGGNYYQEPILQFDVLFASKDKYLVGEYVTKGQ